MPDAIPLTPPVICTQCAQTSVNRPDAPAPKPVYAPRLIRSDEDYEALKKQDRHTLPFPLLIKHVPIDGAGDGYVSFGADYRTRIDSYGGPGFGIGGDGFTSVQHRFQLHADLHLNPSLRLFVQLGAATESGREPATRPADASAPDIAQAFVDLKFGNAWRLRAGRQEIALGRYVTIRDGTNIRRTFDGFRADGELQQWRLTAVLARPTCNRDDAFDDAPEGNESLMVLSLERPSVVPGFTLGLIALSHENRAARYAEGVGVEIRRTFGMRLFGANHGWDIDAQVSYQFGDFTPAGAATIPISAWGAAFEGGYTVPGPAKLRLAVRIDAAGGDGARGDRRLGTFDLPYPNLTYLTDAALFAPRNVRDVQPFASFAATRRLTVTFGTQFLWRNSLADAVYSPANFAIVSSGGRRHYVATQPYARLVWRLSPSIDLQASYVRAMAGAALREAGTGYDIDYGVAALNVRL